MDDSRMPMLLASAAKTLARLPRPEFRALLARLSAAASPAEYAAALRTTDLGFAPEATEAIVRAADGPAWEDHRARLLRAADHARVERMSPSS